MHLFARKTLGLVLISLAILSALSAIVSMVEAGSDFRFCESAREKKERMRLFRDTICSNIVHDRKSNNRGKPKRPRSPTRRLRWSQWTVSSLYYQSLNQCSSSNSFSFSLQVAPLIANGEINKEKFWRDLQTCCSMRSLCQGLFNTWETSACGPNDLI